MGGSGGSSGAIAGFKLIILDEADAMTNTAQMALRRIMEKYTANTRFCIIANYSHKLSPALLSRCTRFRFSPLKEADIRVLVDKVIEEENVKILPEATDSLVKLSKGDMRRALNVLQACHASSRSSTDLPSPHPNSNDQHIFRHTTTNTRRAQDTRQRYSARHHQCGNYLQLYCSASARCNSGYFANTTKHQRRHFLSEYNQYSQGRTRSRPCRHHNRTFRGACPAECQAGGHDHLA